MTYQLWRCHEFECDHEKCSDPDDPSFPSQFVDNDNRLKSEAVEIGKKAGWKFVKRGGVNKIFCPNCSIKDKERNA